MKLNFSKKYIFSAPLMVAIFLTLIIVTLIEFVAIRSTHGNFSYPLDDTYIHMSVAKNIAYHGNWGVNPTDFGSASSSILYSLLLALVFKLFSSSIVIPFIVNLIAGIILLAVVDSWLKKFLSGSLARLIILGVLIFLLPLPVLIVSGMEHTLQCLFTFLFLTKFSDWLQEVNSSAPSKRSLPVRLILYGMLVTGIRYEGLFLIMVVCLMLLFRKKYLQSIQLGFLATLPLIIFGVYSVYKGSFFLPNSVLLKSDPVTFSTTGIAFFLKTLFLQKLTVISAVTGQSGIFRPGISLLATQQLLIILPLSYLALKNIKAVASSFDIQLVTLSGLVLLHLAFATTGWFYRYEAYLFMASMPVVSVILYHCFKAAWNGEEWNRVIMILFVSFIISMPISIRSVTALSKASRACVNIYEQQVQMSCFIQQYYQADVVAVNDLGAVSLFTEARTLDLWGLGNIEVARSKRGKYYTPEFLDSLAHKKGVKIAIVFDIWFPGKLLNKWKKVASWKIQNNVICASDEVSFYALDDNSWSELKDHLTAFAARLPVTVEVKYY